VCRAHSNFAAANGWVARGTALEPLQPGQLHGSAWLARAYRMANLDLEDLTTRAVDVARSANDIDLELVALSQPGLMRVGKGRRYRLWADRRGYRCSARW
jgi:hypothetical protein